MWYGGHGDYMWAGMLVWLLLLALLIGVAVWLAVKAASGGAHPVTPPAPPAPQAPPTPRVSSARAILDERYARGEIDDDEYRRRRTLLDGG